MKRSFFFFFLFISISSILFAKIEFPFIGIISTDKVNVRAGGNLNFEILLKLNKDDKVIVFEERFSWYKIRLPKDNVSCFIDERYLENIDKKTAKVTANHVNLRAKPRINSTILSQANKGQILKIISKQKTWYEIKPPDGCFGWVHRDFVQYSSYFNPLDNKHLTAFTEESKFMDLSKTKGVSCTADTKNSGEKQPVAVGIIEDAGKTIGRPGTHKLIQEEEIFYLKGDIDMLNSLIYQRVKIYGKINYLKGKKYPVISVERLELVK